MSFDVLTVPPFPDVPAALGVPPLLRSALFPTLEPVPVSGDGSDLGGGITSFGGPGSAPPPQWGIFDSGNSPVVTADTVLDFEFKHDYRVADYPIEQGGFASYNKVQVPFEARFKMAKGGSQADRTQFVTDLESIVIDLNLYSVVTPEFTWMNANVVHWDTVRNKDGGVSLITAEIWIREIRVAPPPAFSTTQQPSGQSPQDGGQVQAQAVTPTQQALAQPATIPGPNGT